MKANKEELFFTVSFIIIKKINRYEDSHEKFYLRVNVAISKTRFWVCFI